MTRSSRPPALVLGGSANAVAVIRSLGAAGVPVYHSGAPGSPAPWSRYCRGSHAVASAGAAQDGWARLLLEERPERLRAAVLLACDDDAIEFLARRHEELAGEYVLDDSDPELMLSLLDKERSLALAREAGVPAPARWRIDDAVGLERVRSEAVFPVLVKPIHSHLFQRALGAGGRKFLLAEGPADLERHAATMLEHGIAAIATEKIPGPDSELGSYYTYIDRDGRKLFHYTKRIVRRFPKNEGLACYHRTDWSDELAEMGQRFFDGIGFRGLGNVEFKRDPRDGGLKLIECNPRFTAAQELLVRCGVDTGLLVYRHLTEGVEPLEHRATGGPRYWYPDRDFKAYRELARAGELGLGGWLRSLMHRQCFPYFRFGDPMPSLRRIAMKLRGGVAR